MLDSINLCAASTVLTISCIKQLEATAIDENVLLETLQKKNMCVSPCKVSLCVSVEIPQRTSLVH